MDNLTQDTQKILIIRLGAIGDVVHSTVIAQAIKKSYPQYEIDYLTADYICPLLKSNNYLSKTIPFDLNKKDDPFYIVKTGLMLRREKYDCIINLTNSLKNFILLLLAAPQRTLRRNRKRVHAVDAYFNTACDGFEGLKRQEYLELGVDESSKEKILKDIEANNRPIFILSPGGDNDNKRQGRIWPDEYWIELGNKLADKYNASIFIIGSANESKYHKKYEQIKNSKIFSGKLSLQESAALMSICDYFISGDSGPLHIADAVGAKTIALMGSTTPLSSSAYSQNGVFIEPDFHCRYCGQKKCKYLSDGQKFTPCMYSIKPDKVMQVIEKFGL